MLFNPEESIDFNGNTGPFIQYTYARIRSVIRKAAENNIAISVFPIDTAINEKEKEILQLFNEFPGIIKEAGNTYSPALIANYLYELAKEYNQFYHDYPILKEEFSNVRSLRLVLSEKTANIIRSGMHLLGIEVPEKM
jgi:arginyl-tRNA synthetase